jgi:hypothetical protein
MDLDEALMTPDGPEEAYKPKEVFHPAYQRLGAWLYHRTLFPDDKVLPDANQLVLQNISPLPDVVRKSGPHISQIVDTFEIKKGELTIVLHEDDHRLTLLHLKFLKKRSVSHRLRKINNKKGQKKSRTMTTRQRQTQKLNLSARCNR